MLLLSAGLTRGNPDLPALALDFKQAQLDSRINFSRASQATDVVGGTLTSYALDAPRNSPSNGLLLEEARTNTVRNSAGNGSVAGVVGSGGSLPTNWLVNSTAGLNTEMVGTGVANGFAYARVRVYGTASSTSYRLGFELNSATVAAQGQIWTGSFYARVAAGSLSNITTVQARLRENEVSTAELGSTTADMTVNGGGFMRGIATRTLNNASTARVSLEARLVVVSGQAVDVTLDLAAAQLEQGAFATSYIPTSGAAATRAADSASCALPALISGNSSEGSLQAVACLGNGVNAAAVVSPVIAQVEAASGNSNRHAVGIAANSGVGAAQTITSGTAQSDLTGASWAALSSHSVAYGWRSNDMAFCQSGGAVATDTLSTAGMPASLSLLRLGCAAAGDGYFNGWLQMVRVWPRRLSNDQLRALTA